jgi:hypothetical protein
MAKMWSGFLPQNEEIREKWSELLEPPPEEEQPVIEVKVAIPEEAEGDMDESASLEFAEPIPIYRKD